MLAAWQALFSRQITSRVFWRLSPNEGDFRKDLTNLAGIDRTHISSLERSLNNASAYVAEVHAVA